MGLSTSEIKEIRKKLRQVRAEMKSQNIRIISCFNAGLTNEEMQYNQQLFALKAEMSR